MAAAYAALVSLMHIVEQIQNHPRPPISLDKQQVESLTEKITFLQDFLEAYNPHGGQKEADVVLSHIADAAYAAEDIIESRVVDQILAQSTTTHDGEKISSVDLYQGLQKVIQDMDFIKKEVMEFKDKTGTQDQLLGSSESAVSVRSTSTGWNTTMVGFDDALYEILDKLTGQQCDRQIIPIVGMGGIGKTTLAKNVYENSLVVQYFDIHAWVTVSQAYNLREILLEVLCQENQGSRESLSQLSEVQLGEKLYKKLSGRRYLIVMDDMWSIEAWDKVKFYFPEYNNGSKIIITTRISQLSMHLTGTCGHEMSFLDEERSWNLFCKIVFGEEGCPLELEKIGKKIAKNCKGLPLSIVVIGGLLAKSNRALKYWEYVAENLNSIVNLQDNERCLKILNTSYNLLPVHLKPCFLYMGIFSEDTEICVSELIKLWVAEGFLKPISGKSLEVVAGEYFKELIDRNLIFVCNWGSNGKIKLCKIHDILRDLCLRKAQNEKFLFVTSHHNLNIPQDIIIQRRIAIHQSTSKEEYDPQLLHALESASLARSLICHSRKGVPLLSFRLLRILKTVGYDKIYSATDFFQLVNSRYLDFTVSWDLSSNFPSPMYLLWNLQTLIVMDTSDEVVTLSEIWKMPQLRHVKFNHLYIPDPSSVEKDRRDDFVLGNLHTLCNLRNFKFGEEVIKRIPNVKKLRIGYGRIEEGFEAGSHYCLHNLGRLEKLESLSCFFFPNRPSRSDLVQNLTFAHSLKKLTLRNCGLYWEDMIITKIGSLPLLEVLKLKERSFIGPKWETVEGQFCSLKFLSIGLCHDLEDWIAENSHFPRLEHLFLRKLRKLKEIPSDIGEIPTLKSIQVEHCSDFAVISAKRILDEQEELGNEGLQIRVLLSKSNHQLEGLASRNFQVEVFSQWFA